MWWGKSKAKGLEMGGTGLGGGGAQRTQSNRLQQGSERYSKTRCASPWKGSISEKDSLPAFQLQLPGTLALLAL